MAAPPIRTVRQIIEGAYRKLGLYASGETISVADMNDGLITFQDLLAEMMGQNLYIPSIVQEAVTLVIDQNSYTIGENGVPDLDTVRPEKIISAFVRSADKDYPVNIIGEKSYASIFDKSGSSSRPENLWYNPTVPNGTIYVYRPPSTADELFISSIKSFADGATLVNDIMIDIGIPRNYHNPLVFLLAIDIAPEHGIIPSTVVVARAAEGKAMLKSLVASNKIQPSSIEFANYNVNSDLIQ